MKGDTCLNCRKKIGWEAREYKKQWTINGKTYSWCQKCGEEHEKNIKEEAERKKREEELLEKIRQYKHDISHCHYCGNKSTVYHYIYDTRDNSLTSTTDNATDLTHQKVFCNKSCFVNWVKQETEKKNIAKDKIKELMDKNNEIIAELQEIFRKLEEQETKCDQCDNTWKVGEDYYYNRKKEDGKRFCSESCYDKFYSQKCDKCSCEIKPGEKSYWNDVKAQTGTLCESCKMEQLKNKNGSSGSIPSSETRESSSPSTSNNPTPPSPSDSGENSPNSPNSPSSPSNPNNPSDSNSPNSKDDNSPSQKNPSSSNGLKPESGYKYASKCLDCKATHDWPNGKPSRCPECKSKNIKVYDQQGQEVQKSKEKKGEIPPYALPLGILFWVGVIALIVWLVKRNKKKKK